MQTIINDNKILFMAVYGSYNYNLQSNNSDIDWRGFSNNIGYKDVLNFKHENNDICINNTMYFYITLIEMIPKYVEILFSDNILTSSNISEKTKQLINILFSMKNDIVTMNLQRMYSSYINDYNMHQKWILENCNPLHNVDYLIHSYRILDILYRFAYSDFKDYKSSIFYNLEDKTRNIILDLKCNNYLFSEFQSLINKKLNDVTKIKQSYNKKPNIETIKRLEDIIKEINIEVVR